MTTKRSLLILVVSAAIIYGIHFYLLHTGFISYNWFHFNVLDIIVFLIFIIGAALVFPGINKNQENFVMPFMVLTTVQLLAGMSIMAAVAYTKQYHATQIILSIVGVFLAMLTVQSILLIKLLRK